MRYHFRAKLNGAHQIEMKRIGPVLGPEALKNSCGRPASVRDEHVNVGESLDGISYEGSRFISSHQVSLLVVDVGARFGMNDIGCLTQLILVARTDGDPSTFFCQFKRHRTAQA